MNKNLNATMVRGLQSFAHGAFYGKRGDMIEMPTATANELAAAGLVVTVTEKLPAEPAAQAAAREAHAAMAQVEAEKLAAAAVAQPQPDLNAEDAPGIKAAAVQTKMHKPLANKSK